MKINSLSRYGFLAGLILGSGITLSLTWLVRKTSVESPPKSALFLKEGFDFSGISSKDNKWRGPDIGEQINLTQLKGKDGSTLAEVVGKRPAMLVAVNPECGVCAVAADEMRHSRPDIERRYRLLSCLIHPQ
jgi:hypothetical protein